MVNWTFHVRYFMSDFNSNFNIFYLHSTGEGENWTNWDTIEMKTNKRKWIKRKDEKINKTRKSFSWKKTLNWLSLLSKKCESWFWLKIDDQPMINDINNIMATNILYTCSMHLFIHFTRYKDDDIIWEIWDGKHSKRIYWP